MLTMTFFRFGQPILAMRLPNGTLVAEGIDDKGHLQPDHLACCYKLNCVDRLRNLLDSTNGMAKYSAPSNHIRKA